MEKKATNKQILTGIRALTVDYSPTVKELADYVGLRSTASMHDRLKRLERLGYIRNTSVIRGMKLTEQGEQLIMDGIKKEIAKGDEK